MANQSIEAYGKHIIIDLYQAQRLNDIDLMRQAINEIIAVTGAKLLFENFHHFNPQGITGIACLAESHISVHTWPESDFAAFDIFMCGHSQPERSIAILERYFGGTAQIQIIHRGKNRLKTEKP